MEPIKIHTLELPLEPEVSRQTKFLSFLRDIGNPLRYTFVCQFFRGRLKLSSADMPNSDGGIGRTTSVKVKGSVDEKEISRFASKLNIAMYLDAKSRDIVIALDTNAVLRVSITTHTLSAEMALNNMWAVIDSTP